MSCHVAGDALCLKVRILETPDILPAIDFDRTGTGSCSTTRGLPRAPLRPVSSCPFLHNETLYRNSRNEHSPTNHRVAILRKIHAPTIHRETLARSTRKLHVFTRNCYGLRARQALHSGSYRNERRSGFTCLSGIDQRMATFQDRSGFQTPEISNS